MLQTNFCNENEQNEFNKAFLDEIHHTQEEVCSLITTPISAQIAELSKGLHEVSMELQSQVREKHYTIISQASHADRLEVALTSVSVELGNVQETAYRLQHQFNSRCHLIENQTKVLGRLHEVSDTLRCCGNLLYLLYKLRSTKDILMQAAIHFELELLFDEIDMRKVEFIHEERTFIINSRNKIKKSAQVQLFNGLKERNELQVGSSLKILKRFQTLDKSLKDLVTAFISEIGQSLMECFDGTDITKLNSTETSRLAMTAFSNWTTVGGISCSPLRAPGKPPMLIITQNFRLKFWKSLHWLIYEELYEFCFQITFLKKSLEEINLFIFINDNTINKNFWLAVENLLKQSIRDCSPPVLQTLQDGLPKLVSSARGLEVRLDNATFVFDSVIFKPLEAGYFNKLAADLKTCFLNVDSPTTETVDQFITIASAEISLAIIDKSLVKIISDVFVANNSELWTKLEGKIKLGAGTNQVLDTPNIFQMQNTSLANIISYYTGSFRQMISNFENQLSKIDSSFKIKMFKSLEQGDKLVRSILQQYVDSMISTIAIIILSMHREPGLNSASITISGPSMYMKELHDFIYRAWDNHVLPFSDKVTVKKCGEHVATRCIVLFVNNLSILRPLSFAGRHRLKNDCIFLEKTINHVAHNLSEMGRPARLLRSMSSLILQSPKKLVEHVIEEESLVPTYIVFFLLFGHGGMELQSPHKAANWSNERLIQWLDCQTSEREKYELVSAALQKYRDNVRRKNSTQYDEVYPLLSTYFEKVLKRL